MMVMRRRNDDDEHHFLSSLVNITQVVWERARWSVRKIEAVSLVSPVTRTEGSVWRPTALNINPSLIEKINLLKFIFDRNRVGRLVSGGERVDIYRLIKGLSGGERRGEERLAGDGETFSGPQSHCWLSAGNTSRQLSVITGLSSTLQFNILYTIFYIQFSIIVYIFIFYVETFVEIHNIWLPWLEQVSTNKYTSKSLY